jgi:DNA replication and repair protein RecF
LYVTALELVDFRSYEHAQLELDSGVTVFLGRNGQGKTNIVEAVGYLATLGSHRVATDQPLIRSGCSRSVVRASVVRDGRQLLLEIEIVAGKSNRGRINKSQVPKVRELLGVLRTVTFAPEDLMLVRGDPDSRRGFIDELMVQRTPRLAGVKADYDRVVKQRNALLKSAAAARGSVDTATLDVWDDHLVQLGSELLESRLALVTALRKPVADSYADLAPHATDVGVSYKSSWSESADPLEPGHMGRPSIAKELEQALKASRPEEMRRGITLVGPHRDDLVLKLGEHVAKGYASHGESWSLVLALRLASFALLREDGDDPVLILDDVFAELDSGRRSQLAEIVQDTEQVLVTAAVPEDVPHTLTGAHFAIEGGRVHPEQ